MSNHCDIKDGEINDIQNDLQELAGRRIKKCAIWIYVANKNALKALSGGLTVGEE